MTLLNVVFLSTVLAGHVSVWVAVYNRSHTVYFSSRIVTFLERMLPLLAAVVIPVVLLAQYPRAAVDPLFRLPASPGQVLAWSYGALCLAWLARIGILVVVHRWAAHRQQFCLASNDTTRLAIERQLGTRPLGRGVAIQILGRLPGNQILDVHVHEKTLRLPTLPDALDGLTITHLSDLHFTGALTPSFFNCVIDRAVAFDSDLVVLTGDIADKDSCTHWIADTLGRLRGRDGTWFVLGNHDKRLRDVSRLLAAMHDAGWMHLGGTAHCAAVRQTPILVAGNELPWFGPAPVLDAALPPCAAGGPFRMLLAHSPDQLPWARRHQFDLMLAGHTHGGQIRLPVIGPIVCPSRFGVRYAGGLFYEPPTLMHVTRGISGLHPIRYNCPPELARLTLTRS